MRRSFAVLLPILLMMTFLMQGCQSKPASTAGPESSTVVSQDSLPTSAAESASSQETVSGVSVAAQTASVSDDRSGSSHSDNDTSSKDQASVRQEEPSLQTGYDDNELEIDYFN